VYIADGVWKWAPNGNATRTNFKLQGEYLRSVNDDRPTQTGWYTQAIYQFMHGWRVGLRTEKLDAGTLGFDGHKNSLMLDWSPSEFSRIRLQYAQDHSRPGFTDGQWFLQYMMSLGAHGAHSF
jgi:outer membrane receptor protein involved in Fe transport